MRCRSLCASFVLAVAMLTPSAASAFFHLAVIDEVMTSYGGDTTIQFVEIRTLSVGQIFVADSVLGAFDGNGTYLGDVLVVPSLVATSGIGVRWLMATAAFQTATGLAPDFIIPAALPAGGGMICWGAPGSSVPAPDTWDHTDPTNYVDCVAYGFYTGPGNAKIGTATVLTADHHSLQRGASTNNNSLDFSCAATATPTNNAGTQVMLPATAACGSAPAAIHDAVVAPHAALNVTLKAGGAFPVRKRLSVKVTNADTAGTQTIQVTASHDCPLGVTVADPDFAPSTPAVDNAVAVAAGKSKSGKALITIGSASAFTSFSHKAGNRCTVTFSAKEATAALPDGTFDPTVANNVVTVELNVTDRNDADTTGNPESLVKSVAPLVVTVPDAATSKTKKVTGIAGNGDIAELAGHGVTVSTRNGTCPFGTVGAFDYIPKTLPVDNPVTILGGKTKRGKAVVAIDPAKFKTTNAKSPTRCIATLTAVGPVNPEVAPLDPSNNTTRLVIDVIDQND